MPRRGDRDRHGAALDKWLKLNAEYAQVWPNIVAKGKPPADAEAFDGLPDKFEKYFSPKPGHGDAANALAEPYSGATDESAMKP